ncbi:hypothetical protein LCGC14_0524710 [marine sediment metagenome]|uniref:Uncharacterized protein n=1 Tax=marine sediment metagenome TaxID=412755 RepID=A0A0F9UIV9_9ZZZZ
MPNKELRTKQIHITFTESEKEKIEQFAKASNETTREFIRNAVFEKIRMIIFPEQFKQTNIEQIDPKTLEEIKRNMEKSLELQKQMNNRLNIAENIESITKAIKDQYSKLKKKSLISDFSKESILIIDLLKGRKSLTLEQISKMINLDIDEIFLILNVDNRFKLNITTGRYELR